jgi:hypothetical protein
MACHRYQQRAHHTITVVTISIMVIVCTMRVCTMNNMVAARSHVSDEQQSPITDDQTWDYIIIGGGTSGSMVAGRLAEAGFSVLLLEAGGRTQSDLGGTDYIMRDKLTIFDVPSQWLDITDGKQWAKYRWPTKDRPQVLNRVCCCLDFPLICPLLE